MANNKIRINQIEKGELSGYIEEVSKPGPSGTDGQLQFASGYGDRHYQMGAEGLFYDYTGYQLGVGKGFIPQYKLHVSGDVAASGNILWDGTGVILSKTGVHNYIYIEKTNDNLVIRKADSSSCFIFDGDIGNYGVGLPESSVPAFELDVSGDQGIRTQSSLSSSKGQIEHELSGTNLVLYNLSGSAKSKISSHEDSYVYGGKLKTKELHSEEDTYSYKNHYTSQSSVVSGNSYTANTGIVSGGFIMQGAYVPSSTGDAGISGQMAFDTGHLYVCINTNNWKRLRFETGSW